MKTKRSALALTLGLASSMVLSGCSMFIFGQKVELSEAETFDGCKNSIFFALYNYYGLEGQHFTNKWLGMTDALEGHGVHFKPETYMAEKDARKFKQEKTDKYDLPEDAAIVMVNNQTWDTSIQFGNPFAKYHPMAVISTCNGVEFASSPILSTGEGIANATMGGFSDTYREAFVNGSLWYLCAKYTAHVLPIFAACVDACDTGEPLRNENGEALSLDIQNWAIQNIDEYDEMARVDYIDTVEHTIDECKVDSSANISNRIKITVTSEGEGNADFKGFEGTKITLVAEGYDGDPANLVWEVSNKGMGAVTVQEDGSAVVTLRAHSKNDKGDTLTQFDVTVRENEAASKARKEAEGTSYSEVKAVSAIGIAKESHHPLVRKINYDKFFDHSIPAAQRHAELVKTVGDSEQVTMKELYATNATNGEADKAAYRTGKRLKCGILAPSSVNDQVGKYIEYMQGYLAEAYNCDVLALGSVDSNHTQASVAKTLINQGADFIISLQDDTDRNAAAEECNRAGVYFAIAGSCQSSKDYNEVKSLPYYIGSIGTSPEEERRAAYYMTEYYLQCMIQRANGRLADWQAEYFTAKKEGNNILPTWPGVNA